MYKDLVEYLVKSLVADEEKVNITEEKIDDKINIVIQVDEADMGRIIGKDGRIIKSIRELVRAYSTKNKDKVSVSVKE